MQPEQCAWHDDKDEQLDQPQDRLERMMGQGAPEHVRAT
jgi:hypothetical protein